MSCCIPDDSGEQMHPATVVNLWDWLAVLCADLNANYYLSKDFEITVSGMIHFASLPGMLANLY